MFVEPRDYRVQSGVNPAPPGLCRLDTSRHFRHHAAQGDRNVDCHPLLAEPAARWLDEQVSTGRYENADTYLADLVECDRVAAEKHAALKAAIDEGLVISISDKSFGDILEEARAEVARA